MPRHAKGPRLYLRRGRIDNRSGRPLPDLYFIRDGKVQIGTGCPPDRLHEAERRLSEYIAGKWEPTQPADRRSDPSQVLITDVLALYMLERAPKLATDAGTMTGFVNALEGWWEDRKVSEVRRSTCQAYVAHRTAQTNVRAKAGRAISAQTARRELEVLSAAIGYWSGEDKLTNRPAVWLPEKPESPRDAMTRSQAAALLWAAMGWRKGKDGRWTRLSGSARANRAHLRRFILIGLYTGTRHAVIRALLWEESARQAWVDLDAGVIYRRGSEEREHKTKKRPVVKLPRRLRAHMRRWRRLDQKRQTERQKANPDFRLVSVLHHGGAPIAGKIRRGFAACIDDAGLPAEITPHWMRHTAATWMMQNGVDVWDAAGFLGMTSVTLERHYGHHRPDYQADAASGVSGKLSGKRG